MPTEIQSKINPRQKNVKKFLKQIEHSKNSAMITFLSKPKNHFPSNIYYNK